VRKAVSPDFLGLTATLLQTLTKSCFRQSFETERRDRETSGCVIEACLNSRPFKISVRTAEKTFPLTITNNNRLTLFKEIIAVYCENHIKFINVFCGRNSELMYIKAVYISS
jgi:hypothetical protein